MVGSPLAAFTNSTERLIARKSYIDYCVILDIDKDGTDGVKCHSPDHPEYYNTVSIKIRSTKKNSTNPNVLQHVNALILQHYLGNCFGEPYNPRVGDLVAVLFMYNEKPLILGPIASIQQPPVMRAPTSEDAKYDYVNKWCQWLKPKKDKNYDYFDHPQGKKPICFKRFHGPVTGEVGCGRDEMTVWDCQKGDADPTCSDCCGIDAVPRATEQWHKIYSTQTESEEAYNSRMELHARCGSYFRVESDNTNEASSSSSEYSEEIGHIRLGNALTESDKRFHFNIQGNRYGDNGVGSFDLHTNNEEVQIASESTGVRFAAIRPEDSQVTWAYELMNFPTTSFIRCYKDGVIEINSLDGNSSITVDGTANKVTVDGTVNVELIASSEVTCTTPLTHVTGNMQIDGTCTHGSCSCEDTFATLDGVDGGQTLCGGTGVDEELTLKGTADASKGCVNVDADLKCTGSCQLPDICGSNLEDGILTLCGTSDVSKGTVNVDADLACTGGCQLPNVCGSDQVDGELTLSGTSDASKGCVTVDSDLECNGALGTTIKSSIKSYCDGLYSSPSITIGPSPSNNYVTDGTDDVVQFDAVWDELRSNGGGLILIEEGTYDLGDTWLLDNETDPVSWQVVGSGHSTKIIGPSSSPIIMIKNGIMNNRKNSISNIWLTGPSTVSPSSVGIDHNGSECETNLYNVMVSNCTTGIDMRSPSAYNLRLDNVFTKSCLVGLQIKGQNNIINGAITGYDPLAGSSIGMWVEGETHGNTLISCDGGSAVIGTKLTGAGNTAIAGWYDENSDTSLYIDGISTAIIGGFFPTGSTITVTANSHYSRLDHTFSYNGRPTISIASGVVGVQLIDNYFSDYSSKVTNAGSYTGFSVPISSSSTPALGGIQGMVIWNSTASAGSPPGWICTTTGDEGSAVWTALPNL